MLMKKLRQSIDNKIKHEIANIYEEKIIENRKIIDIEMQEINKN